MPNIDTNDIEYYMNLALKEAKKSGEDLPVGCVIIDENKNIIARAHNEKEKLKNPTAHAEIMAIKKACKKIKNWRLLNCSLFVTLEPCPMCAWAILNARIKNVYFGSYDNLYGAFNGKIDLRTLLKNDTKVFGGIKEKECDQILKEYFEKIR